MQQETKSLDQKNLIFLSSLIAAVPFGVAAQNIVSAIVLILLIQTNGWQIFQVTKSLLLDEKKSVVAATVFIALTALAGVFNQNKIPGDPLSFIIGHFYFYAFPILFLAVTPNLGMEKGLFQQGCLRVLGYVTLFWLLVVVSQGLFGWKLEGVKVMVGEIHQRARGLYSHPLTLAYVALMLLPLSVALLKRFPRHVATWLGLMSVLAALYFSASRTAQGVALMVIFWNIVTIQSRRLRIAVIASFVGAVALILITPNRVSKRMMVMIEGSGKMWSEEKESFYPDDRLAFWHAHWQMLKEKPILGHGPFMKQADRREYYESIGLPGFKKAYEAHNQLLQVATEGGVLSLGFFLCWLYFLTKGICRRGPTVRTVYLQTLFAFLVGGLTQNAFHDSEVRFTLMVLLMLAFTFGTKSEASYSSVLAKANLQI